MDGKRITIDRRLIEGEPKPGDLLVITDADTSEPVVTVTQSSGTVLTATKVEIRAGSLTVVTAVLPHQLDMPKLPPVDDNDEG